MAKIRHIFNKNANAYLKTVDEARDLYKSLDYGPTRFRLILVKTFKDYYAKKISEIVLLKVGSILNSLQFGAWDQDPDISGILCGLDDFNLDEDHKEFSKEERENYYLESFNILSNNVTICVSLPTALFRKLEKENKFIYKVLQELFAKSMGK